MPRIMIPSLFALFALCAPVATTSVALAADRGEPAAGSLAAELVEVIPDADAPNHTGWLDFRSANGGRPHLVDDLVLTTIIEQTHKTLLADHPGSRAADLDIGVRLTGVAARPETIAGRPVHVITAVDSIYPDHPGSDRGYRYADLAPGRPAADFHHRYLEVPVRHDDPSRGTFELYYELCSDYDPARPVILVPTDGQRTFSQVGWADRYQEMFGLEANTVTYEYRGMPCSPIPGLDRMDWRQRFQVLNTDQVVADMECIRRDLLGDGKIDILGGSGTAMMGLKYLAAHPRSVERAFLMSFFLDARGSSEAPVVAYERFLAEHDLAAAHAAAVARPGVAADQLLFLVQRLLYHDRERAAGLIRAASDGDLAAYREATAQLGTVDFFVRSIQAHRPWTVVFMYETNLPTALGASPDINQPFLRIAAPLRRAFPPPVTRTHLFGIDGLREVTAQVLLVGGTRDQVAPLEELARIDARLPDARLAVFDAYHCLQAPPGARQARAELANLFFRRGLHDPALDDHLAAGRPANGFLELR